MVKIEKYFEGGSKILAKSYKKSLFISKYLANGVFQLIKMNEPVGFELLGNNFNRRFE